MAAFWHIKERHAWDDQIAPHVIKKIFINTNTHLSRQQHTKMMKMSEPMNNENEGHINNENEGQIAKQLNELVRRGIELEAMFKSKTSSVTLEHIELIQRSLEFNPGIAQLKERFALINQEWAASLEKIKHLEHVFGSREVELTKFVQEHELGSCVRIIYDPSSGGKLRFRYNNQKIGGAIFGCQFEGKPEVGIDNYTAYNICRKASEPGLIALSMSFLELSRMKMREMRAAVLRAFIPQIKKKALEIKENQGIIKASKKMARLALDLIERIESKFDCLRTYPREFLSKHKQRILVDAEVCDKILRHANYLRVPLSSEEYQILDSGGFSLTMDSFPIKFGKTLDRYDFHRSWIDHEGIPLKNKGDVFVTFGGPERWTMQNEIEIREPLKIELYTLRHDNENPPSSLKINSTAKLILERCGTIAMYNRSPFYIPFRKEDRYYLPSSDVYDIRTIEAQNKLVLEHFNAVLLCFEKNLDKFLAKINRTLLVLGETMNRIEEQMSDFSLPPPPSNTDTPDQDVH